MDGGGSAGGGEAELDPPAAAAGRMRRALATWRYHLAWWRWWLAPLPWTPAERRRMGTGAVLAKNKRLLMDRYWAKEPQREDFT